MTLDELYPLWRGTHDDFLETVGDLTDDELHLRPHSRAASVRDIVLRFLLDERFWVSHLVAGNAYETPRADQYPDGHSLAEALAAARDVTARVLAPFGPAGLRAVRRVPPDARENRPETNMPVGWFFWHVLECEISALAQVRLRLDDERKKR